MKKKIIITIFLIIALVFTIYTISIADTGSYDRYDGDYSGESDSGFSWDSTSSSSAFDSSSSEVFAGGDVLISIIVLTLIKIPGGKYILMALLAIDIAAVLLRLLKKREQTKIFDEINKSIDNEENASNIQDVSQTHIHSDRIKAIDPNFSEDEMESYAKELYIKLQEAWTAREWEKMRPYETENLFEQHNNQLQNYIDTNRINIVEDIRIAYATVYRFRQEGDRDILEIALKATKKDYIIDATTKEVLEGNKEQDRTTMYKLTFERKSGVLTPEKGNQGLRKTNCPNCGALIEFNTSGKCLYCGSIIITGNNTWELSGLEPLRK